MLVNLASQKCLTTLRKENCVVWLSIDGQCEVVQGGFGIAKSHAG
jgi:hypothetical protein